MNANRLLRPLALLLLSLGAASCVTGDWDDYDDGDWYDDDAPRYRRRPPPPPDYYDYDDRYDYNHRSDYDDRRERRHRDRDETKDRTSKPPKGFTLAGSFQAGHAVECGIPTSKKIRKVRLVGRSGTVSVNTVVLREGSAKTSFPVTRRILPGETAEIDLGAPRQATGLRISAGGKGSFDVYVQ